MTPVLLSVLVGYLIGSFPTSIIVSKLVYRTDIREFGSGNAGGTNMARVFGMRPGLFVGTVDVLKGAAATLLGPLVAASVSPSSLPVQTASVLAGCAAVLGHVWPVFAAFRGGKGVATTFGLLIGHYPLVAPVYLILFLALVRRSRFVSVGSIGATLLLPPALLALRFLAVPPPSTALLIASPLLAALVAFTHRGNIRRLREGTENPWKSGNKKNAGTGET